MSTMQKIIKDDVKLKYEKMQKTNGFLHRKIYLNKV